MKKNVPWHILAPSAVACDKLHLRASAHLWHVSAFFVIGFQEFPITKSPGNDVHSHHSRAGYSAVPPAFKKETIVFLFTLSLLTRSHVMTYLRRLAGVSSVALSHPAPECSYCPAS